tara:strand:+ start:339 stop:554 length:216 start_codon:yes stop_codon:yes gene_type:complete
MGEVIKFPETQGDYLVIVVGEDDEGHPIVCLEQCLTDGVKAHVNAIFLEVEQIDILIRELTVVSSMFAEKH